MEEQEQELLHLKQEYLKAEIIGKNLDQNKFLDFCLSQKENGDDLNNWTFDELKICVKNFNDSLKQEESQQNKSSSLNLFLSSSKSNTSAPFQFHQISHIQIIIAKIKIIHNFNEINLIIKIIKMPIFKIIFNRLKLLLNKALL